MSVTSPRRVPRAGDCRAPARGGVSAHRLSRAEPDPVPDAEHARRHPAAVHGDVHRPDPGHRSGRDHRHRLDRVRAERLPAIDDRRPRRLGAQARRRPGLPVHRGDDLHLHPQREAAVPQRAPTHLQRREVQHRAGDPAGRRWLVGLAAVLLSADRHSGRADDPLRAQPARHPVRLGPRLIGGVDRRRGGLRRRPGARARRPRGRLGAVPVADFKPDLRPAHQVHLLRRAYAGPAARAGLPHHARLGVRSRTP